MLDSQSHSACGSSSCVRSGSMCCHSSLVASCSDILRLHSLCTCKSYIFCLTSCFISSQLIVSCRLSGLSLVAYLYFSC
ncbi:hypothetical protein Mapa_012762 [Marchantia paleacea]|nr:hypothetical protein Mapa_012762 [Marchantia paleacea]